jgi:hypothetical protein
MLIYDFEKNLIYDVDENGKRRPGRPRKIDPRPPHERPAIHAPLYTAMLDLLIVLRRGAQSPITPALLTEIRERVAVVEGQIERQREWSKESTPDIGTVKASKGPTARAREVKRKHEMVGSTLEPITEALRMAREGEIQDAADAVSEIVDRLQVTMGSMPQDEPEEEIGEEMPATPTKVVRQKPLVLPDALQHCSQMDAALKYLRETYPKEGRGSTCAGILYGLDGWAIRIELLTQSSSRGVDLRKEAA